MFSHFHCWQDTVLGLQGLAGYAEMIIDDSTDLYATMTSDTGLQLAHNVTADNAIVTRKQVVRVSSLCCAVFTGGADGESASWFCSPFDPKI